MSTKHMTKRRTNRFSPLSLKQICKCCKRGNRGNTEDMLVSFTGTLHSNFSFGCESGCMYVTKINYMVILLEFVIIFLESKKL